MLRTMVELRRKVALKYLFLPRTTYLLIPALQRTRKDTFYLSVNHEMLKIDLDTKKLNLLV